MEHTGDKIDAIGLGLKACPFCGIKESLHWYTCNNGITVLCNYNAGGCGSQLGFNGAEGKTDAIKRWNTRDGVTPLPWDDLFEGSVVPLSEARDCKHAGIKVGDLFMLDINGRTDLEEQGWKHNEVVRLIRDDETDMPQFESVRTSEDAYISLHRLTRCEAVPVERIEVAVPKPKAKALTPAEAMGLKVGQVYYVDDQVAIDRSLANPLRFVTDDGSECPKFEALDGSNWWFIWLSDMNPVAVDVLAEPVPEPVFAPHPNIGKRVRCNMDEDKVGVLVAHDVETYDGTTAGRVRGKFAKGSIIKLDDGIDDGVFDGHWWCSTDWYTVIPDEVAPVCPPVVPTSDDIIEVAVPAEPVVDECELIMIYSINEHDAYYSERAELEGKIMAMHPDADCPRIGYVFDVNSPTKRMGILINDAGYKVVGTVNITRV